MKSQSYMTRALRSRDPRYARVLRKLGYGTMATDIRPHHDDGPDDAEDLAALREEYTAVVGKRPFNGWDAATLRGKIAAHLSAAD